MRERHDKLVEEYHGKKIGSNIVGLPRTGIKVRNFEGSHHFDIVLYIIDLADIPIQKFTGDIKI